MIDPKYSAEKRLSDVKESAGHATKSAESCLSILVGGRVIGRGYGGVYDLTKEFGGEGIHLAGSRKGGSEGCEGGEVDLS